MSEIKTIQYDSRASGVGIINFPFTLEFSRFDNELGGFSPSDRIRGELQEISAETNIYRRTKKLADYLRTSKHPDEIVLRIFSMFSESDPAGILLTYSLLLVIPPIESIASDFLDFTHTSRVMEEIESGEMSDSESIEWFRKKVMLLSISKPLPNRVSTEEETPWRGWSEGVMLALASPDEVWDGAVVERLKVELEAYIIRLTNIMKHTDSAKHPLLSSSMIFKLIEAKTLLDSLREELVAFGRVDHVIASRLKIVWEDIENELNECEVGKAILNIIKRQKEKMHTIREISAGLSVLRGIYTHPILKRGSARGDLLSILYMFIDNAGRGQLQIAFSDSMSSRKIEDSLSIQGFRLDGNILSINLGQIPYDNFVDEDGLPRDVKWSEINKTYEVSYKSLVLSYLDNDSFLIELLNNPKIAGKPGIVSLIALRCRSIKVLSLIASRRDLYSGFANRDVPMNLLMNPARIPISTLRKFIHVRYVDKVTLQSLARRGTQVREEVKREIARYLRSLG